jgi:hypothetical protein
MRGRRSFQFVAIPLTLILLGGLFLLFFVSQVGAWAWVITGLAGACILGWLGWEFATGNRHAEASDAPRVGTAARGANRQLLVVTDDACTADDLRTAVAVRSDGRPSEVLVIAPAFSSRLDRLTGDQSAYDAATQRLNATLSALTELGVEARGRLGSHDAIQATDEALREFPAEQIVFALQSAASSTPSEQEIVALARTRYDVEITTLTG